MYNNVCMYFDPKSTKYPYPEYTDGHYLDVVEKTHYVFDENYPYIDTSKKFRRKQFWVRFLLRTIVFPMAKIRFGLKVNGKKNLKTYKLELSQGVISVTNHIHFWDYIFLMRTVKPRKTNVLVWAPNVNGPDGPSVRLVGGIPIPEAEGGLSAMKAFNAAFDEYNRLGYWFHIFPEAKRWDWYKPLRPFQKGAFTMAYKYNKPLLPFAVTYRPRTGIWRLLGPKNGPLTQVIIGAPIYPDTTQPRAAETERLLTLTHETICRLAGIEQNTWPSSL